MRLSIGPGHWTLYPWSLSLLCTQTFLPVFGIVSQLCSEWFQFNPFLSSVSFLSSPELLGTPTGDASIKIADAHGVDFVLGDVPLFIYLGHSYRSILILLRPFDRFLALSFRTYNPPRPLLSLSCNQLDSLHPYNVPKNNKDLSHCHVKSRTYYPITIGGLHTASQICIPNPDTEIERMVRTHKRGRDPDDTRVALKALGNRSLKLGGVWGQK